MTMEQLLASTSIKPKSFTRGEKALGTVISILDNEIIIDLGAKAEGVLSKRDLSSEELAKLKVGDELESFVAVPENNFGQIILSPFKQSMVLGKRAQEQAKRWQKFITAMQRKSKINGRVTEVNKGGLVVEVDGVRGFLPSSHIGLSNISGSEDGLAGLVGQEMPLNVIEVDPNGNRLIFSARKQVSQEVKDRMNSFKEGQKVSAKVTGFAPFGLIVDLDGVEGVVYNQEVAWEIVEDLPAIFEVGEEIEALVVGKDEVVGSVNLSIKQLQNDPFDEIAEKFIPDDVVSGTVTEVTTQGVNINLSGDIAGFIPAAKIEHGTTYQVGEKTSFLVDSVDKKKRVINLAPFLTSTIGLIYK